MMHCTSNLFKESRRHFTIMPLLPNTTSLNPPTALLVLNYYIFSPLTIPSHMMYSNSASPLPHPPYSAKFFLISHLPTVLPFLPSTAQVLERRRLLAGLHVSGVSLVALHFRSLLLTSRAGRNQAINCNCESSKVTISARSTTLDPGYHLLHTALNKNSLTYLNN